MLSLHFGNFQNESTLTIKKRTRTVGKHYAPSAFVIYQMYIIEGSKKHACSCLDDCDGAALCSWLTDPEGDLPPLCWKHVSCWFLSHFLLITALNIKQEKQSKPQNDSPPQYRFHFSLCASLLLNTPPTHTHTNTHTITHTPICLRL